MITLMQSTFPAGSSILGYDWIISNPVQNFPNYNNALFVPTLTKLQTLPYVDPAGQSPPTRGLTDASQNNALLYLQMTQDQTSPIDQSLQPRDNWIQPGISATLCIGKTEFFDNYLLRSYETNSDDSGSLLTGMNFATYWESTGLKGHTWIFNYYQPLKKNANFYNWTPIANGIWRWSPPLYEFHQGTPADLLSYTSGKKFYAPSLNVSSLALYLVSTTNMIRAGLGTNKLTISGGTVVKTYSIAGKNYGS